MSNQAKVTGFKFALIYADELGLSQTFYQKYLGFEKTADFSETEVFGRMGAVEAWIGGGYEKGAGHENSTRATVMLGVDSAGKLFDQLKSDGIKVVQEAPVEMQPGVFWLQFFDPAGNVVEILGGE